MTDKTPATGEGGRGLEMLAGILKLKNIECGADLQPTCGGCVSYTTDLTQHAEFGHCKRFDPDIFSDGEWEMVAEDAYRPCFRPRGAGSGQ